MGFNCMRTILSVNRHVFELNKDADGMRGGCGEGDGGSHGFHRWDDFITATTTV